MARVLNEKQLAFLDHLFGEAQGNTRKAKILAGYAPESSTASIVKGVEEEIVERTKRYLVEHGPKAVIALMSVIEDPTQLGVQHKVAVAKDLLDRIGVIKTEKVEVSQGAFILPPKGSE